MRSIFVLFEEKLKRTGRRFEEIFLNYREKLGNFRRFIHFYQPLKIATGNKNWEKDLKTNTSIISTNANCYGTCNVRIWFCVKEILTLLNKAFSCKYFSEDLKRNWQKSNFFEEKWGVEKNGKLGELRIFEDAWEHYSKHKN